MFSNNISAGHLIGGDFSYRCIGSNDEGNEYEVELTVYRNCECRAGSPFCANFDGDALISVFDGNNQFVGVFTMNLDTINEKEVIPLQTDQLCLKEEPEVCVERSTGYREQITLPPSSTGYTLNYMRCCRNASINNLNQPEDQGSTYILTIPPNAEANCNSSPVFRNLPPIILCAGYPFEFDHSAIDPDGDDLVYELCTPFDYPLGPDQPQLFAMDAIPSPPYQPIVWGDYFSAENQIGGRPKMTIDRNTGLLTAFPDYVGRYVIGICVSEYRNGELLNTTIRDYQLKIVDCDVVQAEIASDDIDAEGNFILKECEDYTVQFINQSEGTESFYWQFGDSFANGMDTSSLRNPLYEYPDTGRYEVTLIANPNKLCADTANIILDLYPKMVVDFDWEATCAGGAMPFTNQSTSDYGTFTNFSWSFGDGNISALQDPENIFDLGGDYEVFLTATNSFGCTQELAKQVDVKPTPETDFGNTSICIDQQPINFSDLSEINIGNIVSRAWQITNELGDILLESDDLNIEYTFTSPGNYNILLTAIGDQGCSETTTSSITLYEKLVVDAGMNKDVCIGSTVVLSGQVNVPATFLWSTDIPALIDNDTLQNPTITPLENTIVTLIATDPNGCVSSDNLQIVSQPLPNIQVGRNDTLCLGDSFNLNGFGEIVGNGIGQISYQWSPDSFITNTNINNPIVNPQDDITYYLTITENEFNCANTDSIFIKVLKPINTTINYNLTTCELEPIQLMADGGDFYNWQPPTGLNDPTSSNPIATLEESTNYIVDVSNVCFSGQVGVFVNVQPAPNVNAGNDVVIDIGDIIQFNATVENNAETIQWLPNIDILSGGNTTNPELQPLQTRDYIIIATSEFGCSLTDTVAVTVNNIFNLWVPSAFTPNDDGTNDIVGITPKGIKNLDIFRIYNRWGQKVFETNDINQKWDGTFNGKPQELGVYVYYAIGITFLDELYKDKGNITLIR